MTNVEKLIELGILTEAELYVPGADVKSDTPYQAEWGPGRIVALETTGDSCPILTYVVEFKDGVHRILPKHTVILG
jgi:hypothetical protein